MSIVKAILFQRFFVFLAVGVFWLFVFSIPLSQDKRVFHLGYYYLVDTAPVHWVLEKLGVGAKFTSDTTLETIRDIIGKITLD